MAGRSVFRALLLAVAAELSVVTAVTPQELEKWFASASGLNLGRSQAAALAAKEAPTCTAVGVEVRDLSALKDVLYLSSGMAVDRSTLQKELLPLAYQHASPQELKGLYDLLIGGWWSAGGLSLPKAEAQTQALMLAKRHAAPALLKELYQALYGYTGIQLPQGESQGWSIQLTAAGADAAALKTAYKAAISKGRSPTDAVDDAVRQAVALYLQGLPRRYAKSGDLYSAKEFQQYYSGSSWLDEWHAGPVEKRVASDFKAYATAEFQAYYSDNWIIQWSNAKVATQERIAMNGQEYTLPEFKQYYSSTWRELWSQAPEAACQECHPYDSLEPSLVVV